MPAVTSAGCQLFPSKPDMQPAAIDVEVIRRQTEDLSLPRAAPCPDVDHRPVPGSQPGTDRRHLVERPGDHLPFRCLRRDDRLRRTRILGNALVVDGRRQDRPQMGEDNRPRGFRKTPRKRGAAQRRPNPEGLIRWAMGESTCTPGSVSPRRRRHAGRRPSISTCRRRQVPAAYPQASGGQPSIACAGGSPRETAVLALLRVGFTKPPRSPGALVGSYPTVSPLPRRPVNRPRGGLFSVALSRGSPRVAVNNHPALWSPDVPRRRLSAPTRPPSRLTHRGHRTQVPRCDSHRSRPWRGRPQVSLGR